MYAEEMEQWIAEAKREEANSEARIAAALMQDAAEVIPGHGRGHGRGQGHHLEDGPEETISVLVGEGGEGMTVVHRNVLPDLTSSGSTGNGSAS